MAPNVHDKIVPKKGSKNPGKIPRQSGRSETTLISGPVKDSVKIPTDNSRGTRVDVIHNKMKKVVSSRVPVRSVQANDMKRNIIKRKSCPNKATRRVQKRATKTITRTVKEHRAARVRAWNPERPRKESHKRKTMRNIQTPRIHGSLVDKRNPGRTEKAIA